MFIGALRVEEARAATRLAGVHTLNNGVVVEIFWFNGGHMTPDGYDMEQPEDDDMPLDDWHDKSRPGWYFRVLNNPKDSDAQGPYGMSATALEFAIVSKDKMSNRRKI